MQSQGSSAEGTAVLPTGNETPATFVELELPQLHISTLKGDLDEWVRFWEQFNQTIPPSSNLTPSTKLYYLKAFLAGDAAAATAGLATSELCYADAITMLKGRFGDRTRLIPH